MRHLLFPAIFFVLAVAAPARNAAAASVRSERLILENGDWMIKPGFTEADANGFRGDASAMPVDSFPVSPNAFFHIHAGSGLRHFTVETVFRLSNDGLAPTRLLGLQLASIGENWEIFVNGHRIAAAMHLDPAGGMASHRSLRDLLVPLPRAFLRPGDNTLVIHLAGNAPATAFTANTALGFYKTTGYVIDDFDVLYREHVEFVTPILLAVLFVFGFYAAVSFYYRTQDRHHLHFGFLSTALFFYYVARSPFIFEKIGDTEIITRTEYASLLLLTPALVNFLQYFFFAETATHSRKLRIYTWVSAGFAGLMVAALPFGYTDDLLRLWQISAFAVALLTLWIIRAAVQLRRDYARELLLGTVFLSVAVMFDVIDSAFFSLGFRFSQYAFLLFVGSLAWVSAKRTLEMRRQTERLNHSLLEQENRLKSLFEAAFEAIVIHDGGVVVDCNPAFLGMFGLTAKEAIGNPLTALLAASQSLDFTASTDANTVNEMLATNHTGESFHVQFVSKRHPYKNQLLDMTAIRDIHARKMSEEKLRERNDELELMINAMDGRERRMNELQQEVDKLK